MIESFEVNKLEKNPDLRQFEDLFMLLKKNNISASLTSGDYKLHMKELQIDKFQVYQTHEFLDLFEKILIALAKTQRFEEFDEVASNLFKFDLHNFFFRVLFKIVQFPECSFHNFVLL